MRILYVNDALAISGGLERILIEKINLLADLYGYEMYIVTTNQGRHPLPYPLSRKVVFHDLGIQFHQQHQFRGLKRLLKRWQLIRLFRKRLCEHILSVQPDVIVSVRAEMLGAILKAKGRIPLLFESHGIRFAKMFDGSNSFHKLLSTYYNRRVRYADMVVALSEGDAADWRSLNSRVCVIPNVVHLSEDNYSQCQNKSVIFIGRFSYQKDIGSLIRIWEIVYSRHPDWQLNIYGGYGDDYDNSQDMIRQKNINIIVHAPTSDIFRKYCESSILVLTSRYEPFGLVLPEAMSCGLPVVAFDCPFGPAEIVTDGYDGFLIAKSDIEAFADKVCLLIENNSLRLTMGQAGIRSSRRYGAQHIMPRWKQLFEQLVAERKT